MPVVSIRIDPRRTEFFYLDRGKPDAEIYGTIIILPGHSFHSSRATVRVKSLLTTHGFLEGIFQRVLPLAASKGLRLIAINRRDYAPTTLFDETELKELSSNDPALRENFLHNRGIELCLFTDHIIDELSLPPSTDDGSNGGVAWMGWSLGNANPIAAVVAGMSLPDKIKDRLQNYLRKLIIYGA